MADIKTAEERSRNMAAIKSKNTSPELFLRHLLFAEGYRYRLHSTLVPGHPDIWLKKYNTAIFVNGCFWHRHKGCKYAYMPKSRVEYWSDKFKKNIAHDDAVRTRLSDMGIRSLVVWECTIKKAQKKDGDPLSIVRAVSEFLLSDEIHKEL